LNNIFYNVFQKLAIAKSPTKFSKKLPASGLRKMGVLRRITSPEAFFDKKEKMKMSPFHAESDRLK